jgi:hypothetical protein
MKLLAKFGFKPPKVIMPTQTKGFDNIMARINETPTGMILRNPNVHPEEKLKWIESLEPSQQRQVGRDYTRMSNISSIKDSRRGFADEVGGLPKNRRNISNPKYVNAWLDHQSEMAEALENNDRFAKQVLPEYQNMANRNNNIAVLRRMARD